MPRDVRRICFVTGTRAEFGLMRSTLQAIKKSSDLKLQIVVTGMHLHEEHGQSIEQIRREGWTIDAVVPWNYSASIAQQTGLTMARLAEIFDKLKTDIVLVVGDRVEAFAAASAGHICQKIVAHIHGGDRAIGQVDDSLRHAISKLAHIHFAATDESASRLLKLGEDRFRVHQVGSPGIDGIVKLAAKKKRKGQFALLLLHPVDSSEKLEFQRAEMIFRAIQNAGIDNIVAIYPNSDPGSRGIIRCWEKHRSRMSQLLKDIDRPTFLGLLRDAAVLVGNSSSGIIEAASFGTPVVDIGPRQHGRQRSQNVTTVPYKPADITAAIKRAKRRNVRNVYGGKNTGDKIAKILATIKLDQRLGRKLIAY